MGYFWNTLYEKKLCDIKNGLANGILSLQKASYKWRISRFQASGYMPPNLFRKAEEKKVHITSQSVIRPEYVTTLRSLEYKCGRNF